MRTLDADRADNGANRAEDITERLEPSTELPSSSSEYVKDMTLPLLTRRAPMPPPVPLLAMDPGETSVECCTMPMAPATDAGAAGSCLAGGPRCDEGLKPDPSRGGDIIPPGDGLVERLPELSLRPNADPAPALLDG